MTRDEQTAITAFIDSALRCDAQIDVEADAIIRALFVRQPDAAYRITLLAMQLASATSKPDKEAGAAMPGKGWLGAIFDKAPKTRRQDEPTASQSAFIDR